MWRTSFRKTSGRIVSISAVATILTVLMITTSIPFGVVAQADSGIDGRTVDGEDGSMTFAVSDASTLSEGSVIDSALKNDRRPNGGGFEIKAVPFEGLERALLPDYARKPGNDNPSPTGSVDPEPMDAPFRPNDALVFNDAANSESSPSIARAANGDLYVAYDHDIGSGLRDTYVSKSTDGGLNWAKRDIAVDAAEDESCPSMAIEYSPMFGGELMYTFYNNPEFEFSWSADGDTWTSEDFGGGMTFWSKLKCPYVAVQGDFVVVVGTYYDDINLVDTFYVFYTLDNFLSTLSAYYFILWSPDVWASQVRATIVDSDEILVAFDVFDKSNPNPSNWFHDTMITYATLAGTGNPADDNWPYWQYATGLGNQDFTSPTVEAYGKRVTFVTEIYDPSVLPLATSMLYCLFTLDITVASPSWFGCDNDNMFIAFDVADVKNQKHPSLHLDEGALHLVWLNATDVNYKFSPDGGLNWIAPHLKVNDPGSSTAIVAWHSPVVTSGKGKPFVAWHDSRGSDNIYFQTFANSRWFGLRADPSVPDLETREVGDSWHKSSYYYLWADGSGHDVEAQGSYEIPMNTLYAFNQWDDGSLLNPTTVTVSSTYYNITAIYDTSYWLDMISPAGTTPVTGYQLAGSMVTIEAFPPVAPPGARYAWAGWLGVGNGSYTGPSNPCINCVIMNEPITQTAGWQLQWNVTIDTDPTGLAIEIDGVPYFTPYIAWFNDSQAYNLNAASPQTGGPSMRYAWSQWDDFGAQSHNVSVTSAWVNFTAFFSLEYWLTVDTDPSGFNVKVNGVEYKAPYSFWCPEGSGHWFEAPSPQYSGISGRRYVWLNWSDGGAQVHVHTCVGVETVTANFYLERSVNITTNPAGFNVIVDGLTYATPLQSWWEHGSNHTVEAFAVVPVGANNRYNFTSWSDFGPRIHEIWANTSDETLTANYVFQHKITLQSNQPGITILFDASPMMLPFVYWCDDGSSHILDAIDPQVFGDTRYVFGDWSDGGSPTHMIICNAPAILQADYVKEYKVYLNSTLDGVQSMLDVTAGLNTFPTPAQVWWPADTMMALDTPEFQPGQNPGSGERYGFVDWDDSSIRTRTINVNAPGLTYVANFNTQYKLSFVDPHGMPMTTPAGFPVADGIYFDAGTVVDIQTDNMVMDTADHRWRFDSWSSGDPGGYTGTNNPATVTMTGPIAQTVAWIDQHLLTLVSAYGTPDASGWYEQQSATEYWYDAGDTAFFWVETAVIISAGERAFFEAWLGGTNGTVMNAELTVTASWSLEFLVTVVSSYGTVPSPTWVADGGSYSLDIEEVVTSGDSRASFTGWTTPDTANGGYQGTNRQETLTVTGPITETATWETQYLLTIITEYGTPEASNWEDQHNATAFWYSEGDSATFWVGDEVFISAENDAKAMFEGWSGGANGTSMNSPITVIATWHLEYLVVIESEFGTVPSDVWVRDGQTHQISIDEMVVDSANENIRYVFASWSTDDTDVGGYQGAERDHVLTVTGPITETAVWTTQFRLRITSTYESELEPLGDPTGEGWYDSGSMATITVEKSEERGEHIYRFQEWSGGVALPDQAATTILMDGPKDLSVEWSKEAKFSITDLWWLFIVIIVIVVAIVAVLLVKRKSGKVDEETADEETPVEETDSEEEFEEADEET
jgi:hypothetical protein